MASNKQRLETLRGWLMTIENKNKYNSKSKKKRK